MADLSLDQMMLQDTVQNFEAVKRREVMTYLMAGCHVSERRACRADRAVLAAVTLTQMVEGVEQVVKDHVVVVGTARWRECLWAFLRTHPSSA